MKVAFISDIHSNLESLEATLVDISKKNVDRIYFLGDAIGYLDNPNGVVNLLRKYSIPGVIGNNDLDIISQNFKDNKIKEWTYKELTKENIQYLKNLPLTLNITIDNLNILLTHGSPNNIKEYLYEEEENTLEYLLQLKEDILIVGHTHIPYIKTFKDKTIINTGSLGKPKHGSPKGTYGLIVTGGLKHDFKIVDVEYDIDKLSSRLREKSYDEKLILEIETGKPTKK